jgi:phytoene dehydrogenase-like protein
VLAPSLKYLERAHADALSNGYSREPVVELVIPSTLDASLAPAGAHVASLFCQHFRYTLPEGMHWDDAKDAAVARVLDTVDAHAPNFSRAVLGVDAYTPLDLERRFGLVGGDIFHGVMSTEQLYWSRPAPRYAQYRGPVPGLYMCASGSHPGGGVSGAPGHNAANAVLEDLRAAASS